ncbi:MAG: GTPase domain-containing protein [Anaerolineales bacterium]
MSWLEPITAAVEGTSLLVRLARSSKFIRRHASRISYLVSHGESIIPIFGAGGVGKSTLSNVMLGTNPVDIVAPYRESDIVEKIVLKGDIPGQILVAPGQERRVYTHWPDLLNKVVTGHPFGIINVVSYGYHSLLFETYKKHELYTPRMGLKGFVKAYAEQRRKKELELVQLLVNGILGRKKPIWFLTLVNKQDLWWSERDKVKKHYLEGAYSKEIGKLYKSLGDVHFQHEFLPVSMSLGNLTTTNGEVLVANNAGYDMVTHLTYLQSFFARIRDLLKFGER